MSDVQVAFMSEFVQFQMSQHENNNIGSASNLKINSDIILVNPETKTAQILLTNLHQKYTLYFKIKTKIANVFDVKPSLGYIKPGQQKKITFKPLNDEITKDAVQIRNIEQKLQFLLQAVNQLNPAMTKQEQQALWAQIKTKRTHTQLGYCSVKLNVSFSSNKQKQKELQPLFHKIESKILDSRYTNQLQKSNKPVSSLASFPKSNFKLPNNQQPVSDAELSKKYQQLKRKEQKLLKQRQRIFEEPSSIKKPKGPSPIKLVIVLLIGFVLGNYLKSMWEQRQVKPKPVEKGFLDWFE